MPLAARRIWADIVRTSERSTFVRFLLLLLWLSVLFVVCNFVSLIIVFVVVTRSMVTAVMVVVAIILWIIDDIVAVGNIVEDAGGVWVDWVLIITVREVIVMVSVASVMLSVTVRVVVSVINEVVILLGLGLAILSARLSRCRRSLWSILFLMSRCRRLLALGSLNMRR